MPPRAAISLPSHELGRARPIAELSELRARPDAASLLVSARSRLRCYRESDEEPLALAVRSARATLERAAVAPETIDAVLFASDSLGEGAALGPALAELRLANAYPLNVSLSDCANLQIALRVAAALVLAGEFRRVLLISVDVARLAAPASRLIGGGIAVASDGAASLLVREEGAFVVEAAAQVSDAALSSREGHARSLAARVRAHRALFAQLAERAAVRPGAIRRVFANHFAAPVLLPFFEDSGFRREQLHLDSAAEAGHCFGSDCLIGLAEWARASAVEEGDRFLLVGAGARQLGAVLLRAAGSAP